MNLKTIRVSTFALALFGASALAQPHRPPHQPPFRPQPPRTITVTGQGIGGSHVGNRYGACQKAEQRARYDAINDCNRYRGRVVTVWASPCNCSQRGREVNCRSHARGTCRINHWSGGWSAALTDTDVQALSLQDFDLSNGEEMATDELAPDEELPQFEE